MKNSETAFESVLVIDDQPLTLLTLKSHLELFGYKSVKVAEDGEEAIKMLQNNRFDLILCDVQMPIKSGLTVHEEVREMDGYADTPFVMMSATYHEAPRSGHQLYFLNKPFLADDLMTMLGSIDSGNLMKKPA